MHSLLALALATGCGGDSPSGPAPGDSSSTGADPTTTSATVDPTVDPTVDSTGDPSTTDPMTSADVTTDASDSSTGPSGSPCEDTCIAVPEGWNGPVAVQQTASADVAPVCPGAYPTIAGEWFTDLLAMDLGCVCGCTPADVECDTHIALSTYDNANCLAPDFTYSITQTCNSGPAGQVGWWRAAAPAVVGGSCTADTETVPTPAVFESRWTVCGDAIPGEGICENGGVCAPSPEGFEDRLCIWADGDQPCPEGPLSVREVVYSSIDDQRACADCTCGDLAGTCGGTYRVWGLDSCPMGGIQDQLTVEVGDCYQYDPQSAMLIEDLTPNANVGCPASDGMPIGEALPAGPVTVCCSGE